jgi:hypothetical protein
MANVVVEFSEQEKSLLLRHLEGMSRVYVVVNGSGDGPLSTLIQQIKGTGLILEFDDYAVDRLLRHLKGASSYDRVAYDSDPLSPILSKIERARSMAMARHYEASGAGEGAETSPRSRLIKKVIQQSR